MIVGVASIFLDEPEMALCVPTISRSLCAIVAQSVSPATDVIVRRRLKMPSVFFTIRATRRAGLGDRISKIFTGPCLHWAVSSLGHSEHWTIPRDVVPKLFKACRAPRSGRERNAPQLDFQTTKNRLESGMGVG